MVYYVTKLIDSLLVKGTNKLITSSYKKVSGYEHRHKMDRKINNLEKLLQQNSLTTEKTFNLLERTDNLYEKELKHICKDIRNMYNNQSKIKKSIRCIEEYLESKNGYENFKKQNS